MRVEQVAGLFVGSGYGFGDLFVIVAATANLAFDLIPDKIINSFLSLLHLILPSTSFHQVFIKIFFLFLSS